MNTQFAHSRNPWTGDKMTKTNKPIAKSQPVDLASLSICNDPLPEHRKLVGSKYDELFSGLKPGGAIKCPIGTPQRIAGQLRKYLERKGLNHDIKTMSDYGDGFGRVWLIAKEPAKLKRAA